MARKLGIKDNTLALLYALDDGAPHSQIEICRQWMIPKTTLNTIVQECIRKGYAELVSAAHTKEKHILLTPAGRQAAEEALRPLYAMIPSFRAMRAYPPVRHGGTGLWPGGGGDGRFFQGHVCFCPGFEGGGRGLSVGAKEPAVAAAAPPSKANQSKQQTR